MQTAGSSASQPSTPRPVCSGGSCAAAFWCAAAAGAAATRLRIRARGTRAFRRMLYRTPSFTRTCAALQPPAGQGRRDLAGAARRLQTDLVGAALEPLRAEPQPVGVARPGAGGLE